MADEVECFFELMFLLKGYIYCNDAQICSLDVVLLP